MKFLIVILFIISFKLFSAEGGPCGNYLSEDVAMGLCEEFKSEHENKASLQRGAKLFMNYCYGCHSLKYARYNRVARDLGIPEDLFQKNLLFGDQKMGDLMNIGMDQSESKEWFGVAPPDLTLETSLRGEDWVYTYLISFYEDESRPFGVNNKVYENVGMPNVMGNLQGIQKSVCKEVPKIADNGGIKQDPLTGDIIKEEKCGFLDISKEGEVSNDEFKNSMKDLTNFLSYMSDPIKEEREYIGKFVILYLLIFTILSYLLYREFKKDVH
tara:strand:+ start:291 stop:1100 length:810 start_codon:yes stop_codon:yes gene_type:complete